MSAELLYLHTRLNLFFYTVFDFDLVSKEFLNVEIIGTVLIGVGFLVLVFADRVSFSCFRGIRDSIVRRVEALWSRMKSLVPAKGEVSITEPVSLNPSHVTVVIQEHKDSQDSGISEK